jgi:hypothetical protein
MNFNELASLASIVLTVIAYAPYIAAIRKRAVKPHFFSWVIWSITTSVVSLAQFSAEGGVGVWPTAVSAAITLYVARMAWVLRSDISITRLDFGFLFASFAALPAWFVTSDPLWSVVILTVVDVLGFGPTLRKAYAYPHEESLQFYNLFIVRSLFSIFALETRNLTTVLFPAAMMVGCFVVVVLLWLRRKTLAEISAEKERS